MRYPDYESFDETRIQLKMHFYKAKKEAYENLSNDCFDPLMTSIESRANEVYRKKIYTLLIHNNTYTTF